MIYGIVSAEVAPLPAFLISADMPTQARFFRPVVVRLPGLFPVSAHLQGVGHFFEGTEAGVPDVFSVSDNANVILSGGNLTVMGSADFTDGGARVTSGKNSGKLMFEFQCDELDGADSGVGLAQAEGTAPIDSFGSSAVGGVLLFQGGSIYVDGSFSGINAGSFASGDYVSVAVDFVHSLIWFSISGGDWNGNPVADPTLGTLGNGIDISAVTSALMFPAVTVEMSTDSITGNFGQTALHATTLSGYTVGWIT